jgi:hypothetical protein
LHRKWIKFECKSTAKAWVLVSAIGLDAVALLAFLTIKGAADPLIVAIAIASMAGHTMHCLVRPATCADF